MTPALPEPTPRPAEHVPELDGLRGLAALAVVCFHARLAFPGAPWASTALWAWSRTGWCGVDLFFVLSGYLITRNLLRTRTAPRYLARFWAARVTRIAPLYYLYLAGVFLWAPRVGHWLSPGADPALYVAYLGNVPQMFDAHQGDLVDVTWSLSVEEHFYFAWPFVVRRFAPAPLLRVCAAAGAVALACRWAAPHVGLRAHFATPCRLDAMAAGAALACAAALRGDAAVAAWCRARWGPAAVALACVVLPFGPFAGFGHLEAGEFRTAGYSVIAASCAVLVGAAGFGGVGVAWLRARWLVHAGRVSYGIYLLHFAVGAGVARLRPLAPRLPAEAWTVALVAAVVAAAMVTHRLVEAPALRLRRYLA